jgi:Cdc6-like AAA superfamily ATPase
VKPYEALDSRSFRTLKFEELQEAEMLNTVFSKITRPCWKFNPAIPDHIALGKHIWEKVKPSLRLAYGIVETASDIAQLKGDPEVTEKHVDEALKHIRLSGLPPRGRNTDRESKGSHEAQSEARNAAKRGKKEEED